MKIQMVMRFLLERLVIPNPGVVRSNRIGGTSNIKGLDVKSNPFLFVQNPSGTKRELIGYYVCPS